MSHAYPLAKSAHAALARAETAARTRHEAVEAANGTAVASLETEWLTPAAKDLESLLEQAENGPGEGFLQRYEDADGHVVLAVTYWKLASGKPKTVKPSEPAKPRPDHTDDLYFRRASSKKKRKTKPPDPNQLSLFETAPEDET